MEQGNKYYNSNWNSNRPLASTGTVQKFIEEQVALKDIKGGKVINPLKINIDFANFKSLRTEG